MPLKFNPLSGTFDLTGSGGGGGASYLDGEVAVYADLPLDGTAALNSAWLVRTASGVWPVSRKQAGIYIRTATAGSSRDADYTYAGTMPDVFSDAVFLLYDEANTTRTGQFNLGNITAGQNRVLTWPDANGTIARTETFAAPPAIGNTTPSTGAFTTLTANNGTLTASAPVLDLAQTWNNSGVTFTGLRLNVTNTASAALSALLDLQVNGSSHFAVWRNNQVRFIGKYLAWFTTSGFETSAAINGATPVVFCAQSTSGEAGIRPSGNITEIMGTTATSPQEFRVYNTFSSATNHERGFLRWSSNVFQIGTEKGSGGGTARGLEIRTDNVARINISSTGGIGFYGAAASAQPAAVADATDAATTQARLNDLLARLRTIGLIAT